MKKNTLILVVLSVLSINLVHAGLGDMNCRAKLQDTDAKGNVLRSELNTFETVGETATKVIWRTKIDDVEFDLEENKGVYHFRPVMRFSNGQEITTTGYKDVTGAISLYSTMKKANGVTRKTDIRCCERCGYSDWNTK